MTNSHRSCARVTRISGLLASGLMAGVLLSTQPNIAQAGELLVTPKNQQTIFRAETGKLTPKKFKFGVSTSGGKKTWKLKSYPAWFTASPLKGKARKKKKQTVILTPIKEKIDKLGPGIHTKKVQFSYKNGGKEKIVKRNVKMMIEGDPDAGLVVFQNKCIGCHDLFQNMAGPYLRGVYGREAGTANGYNHSAELRDYGKVWEEENLNDWLTNPQKLVPNSKMYLSLSNSTDRMNVIAYLKSLTL